MARKDQVTAVDLGGALAVSHGENEALFGGVGLDERSY
jgi:hypothetical protein